MKKAIRKIPFTIRAMSKSELAGYYNISTKMLLSWLRRNISLYDELDYNKRNLLTPTQVKSITAHLGAPGDYPDAD
jgi:hypothetical protein